LNYSPTNIFYHLFSCLSHPCRKDWVVIFEANRNRVARAKFAAQ